MGKFNLVNYQKINGDEHIEKRLKDTHKDEKNEISESQLEGNRYGEKDYILEKQLDKVRKGAAETLTENQLDKSKSGLVKHRNAQAYTGDFSKLEEQRVSSSTVEKEIQKPSSEVVKSQRWWEQIKSPDGLKVAKKNSINKVAQEEDDDLMEDQSDVLESLTLPEPDQEKKALENAESNDLDFPIEELGDIGESSFASPMTITKLKFLEGVLPGVYIVLRYNPDIYEGNAELIRKDAMEKIIREVPALEGLISEDDLDYPKDVGGDGEISLRAVGDEFENVVRTKGKTIVDGNLMEESYYAEQDVGGTEMIAGTVKVNTPIDDINEEYVIRDVIEFLKDKHPLLKIDKDSFDLSNIDGGEISYIVPKYRTASSSKDMKTSSSVKKKQ